MDELIPWLHQRLDAEEAKAQHAAKGPWRFKSGQVLGGPNGQFVIASQTQRWNAEHIEWNDPVGALDGVSGTRQLIAQYEAMRAGVEAANGTILAGAAKVRLGAYAFAVKCAALRYAHKPGYQEEWRP